METTFAFDPLIPMNFLAIVAVVAFAFLLIALLRGLKGWWIRTFAVGALLGALANPVLLQEERENLSNIIFVLSDNSESQTIANRPEQLARGLANIEKEIGALENFELKHIEFENDMADRDSGSMVLSALFDAASEVPQNRIAAAIVITDGRIHDAEVMDEFVAPVHVLQTGERKDWDRRLVLKKAPAFAILDEEITLGLRIETQGDVPEEENGLTEIEIAIDGGESQRFQVRQNTDLSLPLKLAHGGMNVLQFKVSYGKDELTDRNNSAVVSINGVRDRLRVLLVSGEPYSGGRTWRNLLKSDSAVDLVHFTILRSPDKVDGVPVRELSLIAFPTRELFSEKINEFDLIIFDRYKRRGMLLPSYFQNVADYIKNGGAVLFATGPDFASVNSLFRSDLEQILPVVPTVQVFEEGYKPKISDIGKRHPVTEGLEVGAEAENGEPNWGRWFRQIDAEHVRGNVVMTGLDDKPLLVLDRVGEGRVAVLLSDHAWLWTRGYEGGGPQLELLRRLAHWMMKEPELEEEQLTAKAVGNEIFITRRSLSEEKQNLTVTYPDGTEGELEFEQVAPGQWQTRIIGGENGLYQFSDGEMSAVMALGPAAPREFENAIANSDLLKPLIAASGGGLLRAEATPQPKLRVVRQGRAASGVNWFGVVDRNAFLTLDVRQFPLLPAWAWLAMSALLFATAWWREGR